MANRNIYEDLDQLSTAAALSIAKLINSANEMGRPFSIALSGGSTPKRLHQCLTRSPTMETIKWGGVKLYFGDERTVEPDHEQSNYLMAKTTLFDQLPIPSENIYRIPAELEDHQKAADLYQQTIIETLSKSEEGIPIFDLVLLGIGDDGHIASLFPNTPILTETASFVSPVYVPKLDTWRISITYPVINHAKNIFILAAGTNKADIINDVLGSTNKDNVYPVQRIQPKGELSWYLDRAAAKHII